MVRFKSNHHDFPEVEMNALLRLVPGLHQLSLGIVNVFLLEHDSSLVLIDTGVAGSEDVILNAVRTLGHTPTDVHHIIVTHFHPDHSGSLAALKVVTGARVYMHPLTRCWCRKAAGGSGP
ncbi:MBL fold metallo-hydrolase [Deinococcus malanensis]|uniref:MBL fold metallo-hydrolase n=1 Tax=Deinococcus malanensis TaxID=1706855 RepID=UPI00363DDAAB